MEKEFYTLNVFSEYGIKGGNQLAVIIDASDMDDNTMQIITKQFNYSESTFITKINDNSANVRIFLPNSEISFAGHPTIGTAYLIEHIWRQTNPPRSEITLNLKKGPINIKFETQNNCIIPYMEQFIPKKIGEYHDHKHIAQILGIKENEIMPVPMPIYAPSDIPFIFIPLTSTKSVIHVKPNMQKIVEEFDTIGGEPYIFTPSGIDGGDIHARFFAPTSGINEDPATGSAQASLIMAMNDIGMLYNAKKIIVEQGYEINRPSKIYNNIVYNNSKINKIYTGGKNYLVSKGLIFV